MARDSTGNWSNPDTLVAGTPARASDVNALINDLGAEITDSLSRSGKGGMNAQLKMIAGSAAVPGIAPTGSPNTGIFGKSGNKLGVSANGTEVMEFSSSGPASNATGWVTLANMANLTHGQFIGRLSTSAGTPQACIVPFGQCRLAKSGANVVLSPYKGNLLTINSAAEVIPSGGVTGSPSGLATATFYYVYAYMSTSAGMSLEFSTTAYSPNSATGMQVKFGDNTRTLVGIVRTTTGGAFADSATQRFVRSYFNDPGVALSNGFTLARTIVGGSFAEINAEIRCEFISFGNELITFSADGYVSNSNANELTLSSIGIDSTTPQEGLSAMQAYGATGNGPLAVTVHTSSIAAGYHFATLLGKVTGGTGTWAANSANPGDRVSLKGSIRS